MRSLPRREARGACINRYQALWRIICTRDLVPRPRNPAVTKCEVVGDGYQVLTPPGHDEKSARLDRPSGDSHRSKSASVLGVLVAPRRIHPLLE